MRELMDDGRVWHASLIATYGLVSVLMAAALPRHLPGIAQETAIAYGALLALACALVHEIVARGRREERLLAELVDLRNRHGHVVRELGMARSGMVEIQSVLRDGLASGASLRRVTAEVEVLQRLVDQLWNVQAGAEGLAPRPPQQERGPAPAAAPEMAAADLLDTVREALAQGRVDLWLQPVVSLPQRHHVHYECFSRVRDDQGRLVSPEQWVGLAEREGLIASIDNMLLFRCVQLIRRARKKNPQVGFFCNVSRHSLSDPIFIGDFLDFLRANADLGPNLVFELAQGEVDFEDADVRRGLDALAALGVRFSLDRVTDTHLAPEALAARHVRFVKLESGRAMQAGDGGLRNLRRTLRTAGIELIVEKIEEEGELIELLEADLTLGQGYLFGAPKEAPEG